MKRFYFLMIFGLLAFVTTSCQTSQSHSAKPVKAASEAALDEDAQVDKAAGVLKKGQTESSKQLTELEGETESDQTLDDFQKQQQAEEQRRLHRAITEDKVIRAQ